MSDIEMLSKDGIAYIVSRIIDYAVDTMRECEKDPKNVFYQGKRLAYTEVLDVIKNELIVHNEDIKEYGLDFDIENMKLGGSNGKR